LTADLVDSLIHDTFALLLDESIIGCVDFVFWEVVKWVFVKTLFERRGLIVWQLGLIMHQVLLRQGFWRICIQLGWFVYQIKIGAFILFTNKEKFLTLVAYDSYGPKFDLLLLIIPFKLRLGGRLCLFVIVICSLEVSFFVLLLIFDFLSTQS
jgi:hypothetical protein